VFSFSLSTFPSGGRLRPRRVFFGNKNSPDTINGCFGGGRASPVAFLGRQKALMVRLFFGSAGPVRVLGSFFLF